MKDINLTDYHYIELFKEFLEIGIDDMQYINSKIHELKHRFDNQSSKESEE